MAETTPNEFIYRATLEKVIKERDSLRDEVWRLKEALEGMLRCRCVTPSDEFCEHVSAAEAALAPASPTPPAPPAEPTPKVRRWISTGGIVWEIAGEPEQIAWLVDHGWYEIDASGNRIGTQEVRNELA